VRRRVSDIKRMWTAISAAPPAPWPLVALLGLLLAALAMLIVRERARSRILSSWLEAAEQHADSLLHRDALTGLMSRTDFESALRAAVWRADESGQPLTVMYVGLDGFRLVNETWGHERGDALLRAAADRLATVSGERALARLGGDEFALLCEGMAPDSQAMALVVLGALAQPFGTKDQEVTLTASVGLAFYPEHGAHSRLLVNAGLAMRTAKSAGGAAYAVYSPRMEVDQRDQALLRNDLLRAIDRREFELVFQPKVDALTLRINAAEALLRWNHPIRGLISPAVFIPLAERYGLIAQIGNWVIEEACRQAALWRDRGLRMRVAVNVSSAQLRQDDLVERIDQALRRRELRPERFTCEITESVAMEDTQATQKAFEGLRRAGVHVSIDDFGTGHSSLAALRRLPAAELKIDRAFVVDLEHSEDARAITQAIVQMAHTLDLRVVAEGVETERQRDLLVSMGCDDLQGFLFARPMSAQALALWAAGERMQPACSFSESLFAETAAVPLVAGEAPISTRSHAWSREPGSG
jgi:diguanylate cyclase (GGDEF)-like protein